jgi:dCTP diphosphatase
LEDWSEKDKEHLGEELSDVLIYLIRLSDKCNINLNKVVLDKFKKNEIKYPVEKCKSSSKKYTEYKEE